MAGTNATQVALAGGLDDPGITAVGAALTAAAATAPAGGTGATAGAYDSAANRDIAILAIQTNLTRIAELATKVTAIETALQRMGLMSA